MVPGPEICIMSLFRDPGHTGPPGHCEPSRPRFRFVEAGSRSSFKLLASLNLIGGIEFHQMDKKTYFPYFFLFNSPKRFLNINN